jgi:lysozyme family protein
MSDFDTAVNYVLSNEKGLSNDANDRGGITNFGISLRFLKSISQEQLKKYLIFDEVTDQTIKDLRIEQAKSLYHDFFWISAPFEKIGNQEQANYIFDMAINMGIAPAIKCVQRAIWAVQKRRSLIDDGILGENTLKAIEICGFILMPAMRSERAGFYKLAAMQDVEIKNELNGLLNRAYECQ